MSEKLKQMTITEQAFAYHVRGYNLLPVGKDKRPIISAWKQWQEIRQTDAQILEWFKEKRTGTPNIGIITGKISGLSVIDIDNKKDATHTPEQMLAQFPETLTIATPSGGYHLYYKYQEGLSISANAYPQFPNVDIRSDGGYVVAPPSKTSKEYVVIKNLPLAPFPFSLFPTKKPKKTLTERTSATTGSRNDSLASFAGQLLQATKEEEWLTECLPAVQRANKTYSPPLADSEVLAVFNSIMKKEKERRAELIISPIQMTDGTTSEPTSIKLRKNSANVPYKDLGNVMIVLSAHPYYKSTIRYNEFRQEIEYNGAPLEDSDIVKIQHFLQTEAGLPNVGKEAVYSGITHYAYNNKYDEAQDWLKSLVWDGEKRLATWLPTTTGVDNDEYHRGIGVQWFMGMINRIMRPGCVFDYMLVITGAQGLGKTSLFRIIGGKWYKSYTGAIDNKDFYLALRGAIIIDLDEGATLYRSEAIKIKSIITETHDEFRAPYDRVMKRYPRRFVFSMSTNDSEPFRDVTGNRRYWVLDIPNQMVNFAWLEENREQLFAEAYHYFDKKTKIEQVPMDEARQRQEAHLPDDSWNDLVATEVRKSWDYCQGDPKYSTNVTEIFEKIFPDESVARLGKSQEIRISNIFKKELGLIKVRKMVDGEQKNRWYISEEKQKELKKMNAKKTENPLDNFTPSDPKNGELDLSTD